MRNVALLLAAGLAIPVCGETNYAFRARMAELHPRRLASDAAPVAADEILVSGGWTLQVEGTDPDGVLGHAASDLLDYLEKSMDVRLGRGRGRPAIVLAADPKLERLQSKIAVRTDSIRITGATPREVFQGCCRLEDLMNARGLPAVKAGERTFTRLFSPRMTHSGWEIEKFPEVYMDQLAHMGMDAILVFIAKPPDVTRNGREDIPALVRTAARHGLDVYAYCSFPVEAGKLNPADPGAEEWYDRTYGAIIRNAPGLKGVVCVGESVGFPVRDGTSAGFWWGKKELRVPGKPPNGFYPTLEWVPWIEKVSAAMRRYRPDLDFVFWTYNWYRRPEAERLALLERIPTNVTLHVTFEMGDVPVRKFGTDVTVWDYSITAPGPGAVFRSEAEVAKRRGIRLSSMSNTGGRTWDLGCAPFQPVPGKWIERFRNLREARTLWGLSALMESHHYGFQPNFIAEIAKAAFTAEADGRTLDEALRGIAAREFGRANVEEVLAAWADWTAAFDFHSAHHCDLAGPLRTGPTYPFVLPGGRRPPPLVPVYEYYDGERYGDGWKYLEPEYGLPREELDAYIEMSRREIGLLERGCGRLRRVMDRVPEGKRAFAARLLANGEFHLATARTLLNARLFRKFGFDVKANRGYLLSVLDDEERNVRAALPVVEVDSALGWEPSMLYVADRPRLEWKLRQLDDARRAVRRP